MNTTRVLAALALLTFAAPASAQEPPPLPAPAPAASPAPVAEPAPAPAPTPTPPRRREGGRPRPTYEFSDAPIDAPLVRPAPVTVDAAPQRAPVARGVNVTGLRVNAGLKVAYVPTSGYDLFSSNNALPYFSVDATYAFLGRGRFALAAGLGIDIGGSSDSLRTFDASLTSTRFTVPIEARYGVTRWLWAVAKVGPGLARVRGEVSDPSSPKADPSGASSAFTADATLGAAFAFDAGKPTDGKEPLRFLLVPEVGYMFGTPARVALNANRDSDDVLGTDESTRLGKVALSGFVWRASLGIVF